MKWQKWKCGVESDRGLLRWYGYVKRMEDERLKEGEEGDENQGRV